jgi:hypothetical protein
MLAPSRLVTRRVTQWTANSRFLLRSLTSLLVAIHLHHVHADAGNNDSNANNESTINDNANEDSHNQYNADNNTMTMEDWVNNVEEEFVAVCKGCFEEPCIFVLNKERLVALDESEHVLLVAPEDVPSNNIRRKRLYREMTLIMNGGPLGAGVRRELPDCCVEGIRQMHPSETFMGYMPE